MNANSIILNSATVGVVLSMMTYGFGIWLRGKTKIDFLNPLLISIASIIAILLIFKIDYQSFNESAKYLSYLLTPATVALAIPLYRQLDLLKKNLKAILIGVASGVLTSMSSVLAFCVLFRLSHENYVTLLPKSITTAIGMDVSKELGGSVTISVAVIIITGILGNMLATTLTKLFRIKSPIAVGLMCGTASHAIGTAKAMQIGEIEGAMSSLAIVVSGLMTVVGASFFAMIGA
ncbi:MAG: LrgB family protein [Eubacterium sp.]|jgi:predicted murein hydrolase (TIGR00659 family)|uniref:Putative effector of murein hydrolase n=1 Tax=Eubacterium cellulosolvens (strain ATCC 43171 / JCM 9499 / 6) TaxID=633697 RepID=I5AU32_EUBC6|nr:LrgB family protein [Eubacterium sp.]